MAFRSVAEMFLHRVSSTPDAEAFQYPEAGAPPSAPWKTITWRQTGERVRALACGLRSLGLEDEQRVAILSGTRIEWVLADIAVNVAGGATSTIYPSSTPDECAYILVDSAAGFVFAENEAQARKLLARRDSLPLVKNVVLLEGTVPPDLAGWALTLKDLEERGRAYDQKNPDAYLAVANAITPSRLATLIYTSGTTGQPKGVELTHDCWIYEAEAMERLGILFPSDKQFLWLPLSHVFGKVLQVAQIQIGFASGVEGNVQKIVDNLAIVKPTFVAAVPRIFEKVHNKVVMGAKEGGGLKWKIFTWAFSVGRKVSELRQKGQEPSGLLALQYGIATRLVFSKLHARFGGRLRFFISGSAPLARDLSEFFHAAGILIAEGYGLTESSAFSSVNLPKKYKFGTVGLVAPGTEIKIAESDGEILIKGRGIMRGYHGKPEATAEALDAQGYLHTGDIGHVDAEGFIKITDRKKDLIKTSGGKYIAPQLLEGRMKALCPYVSQVLVHGDKRNFCVALFTLDPEAIGNWAKDNGLGGKSADQLANEAAVKQLVQGYVDQLNKDLPSYETIKKFGILPRDLTIEDGELTASLKVKRKVVEAKYKAILDQFYAGAMADLG